MTAATSTLTTAPPPPDRRGRRGCGCGWTPRWPARDPWTVAGGHARGIPTPNSPVLSPAWTPPFGPVTRVALNLDAWDTAPRRVAVNGRRVRVGWFRQMDAHTIGVTRAAQDRVFLLVVPPAGNHGRGRDRDGDGRRRGQQHPTGRHPGRRRDWRRGSRSLLERAIAVLVHREGMDAQAALVWLRTAARSSGREVSQMADRVLGSAPLPSDRRAHAKAERHTATALEVATHRRDSELHEGAARQHERQGQPGRARTERAYRRPLRAAGLSTPKPSGVAPTNNRRRRFEGFGIACAPSGVRSISQPLIRLGRRGRTTKGRDGC
jgi:Family of unknown function (DUF5994)/ANTAR domain